MNDHVFRSFLRMGTLYVATAAGVFLFLRWYHPSFDGAIMASALLALLIAGALGYFAGARKYVQEAQLLLRSIEQPVFEDGRRVAASGLIEALGPLLRSPIGGKDCVAYQYEIDHAAPGPGQRRKRRRVRDYWGMAVTPFQVQTPAGPVRILGYARLETFPDMLEDEDAYRAAEAHLRSTSFRHPAMVGERLGSLAEPLSTESDTFRDDICADATHRDDTAESPDSAALRKLRLTERRLEAGETVCAVGYYSKAKRALIPTTRGVMQLRILTGSPEAWAADNRQWASTYDRWGTGFAVLGVGAALATRWC